MTKINQSEFSIAGPIYILKYWTGDCPTCADGRSRVIISSVTSTGRISALGLFCTDLAALGPYCQDLGPIFSLHRLL